MADKLTALKSMGDTNIYAMGQSAMGGMPQFKPEMGMMTKAPHKPAAGSNPSASQHQELFGGKKPQG